MLYVFFLATILTFIVILWKAAPSNDNEEKVRAQAEKILGKVKSAQEYCKTEQISMTELHRRIDDQAVKAYQSGNFLFVQV